MKKLLTLILTFALIAPSFWAFGQKPSTPVFANQDPNSMFITTREGRFYYGDTDIEYRFVGTNNYYLHYKKAPMVNSVLDEAQEAGFTSIRMWGFFDGLAGENVNNQAWMQPRQGVFSAPAGSSAWVNCWEALDYCIEAAGQRNIRLVIVLTNFWNDFGGITQYGRWYNERHPDNPVSTANDFFTNPELKDYYKTYAEHLITRTNERTGIRYIDDPTIMAWELMNEPRNPIALGGSCEATTAWTKEMSEFIKSLDPNHLVALGDEGGLNREASEAYGGMGKDLYNGADGVDFEAILALDSIDYGTYHLYPTAWGARSSPQLWGEKWIRDHIEIGKQLNKPVVLEEFGIPSTGGFNRALIYNEWCRTVYENDGAGLMFWMLGGIDTGDQAVNGMYPDYDGYRLLNDGNPEITVLTQYALLFSFGGNVSNISTGVYMVNPYIETREDPITGDINFVTIDDITETNPDDPEAKFRYVIQSKIISPKTIKKVEIALDREWVGQMTLNADNGLFEFAIDMRNYMRGVFIDIDVRATFSDGSTMSAERSRIQRLLKFEMVDFFKASYGETEPSEGRLVSYSTPAYQADLRGVSYRPASAFVTDAFSGGAYALDCAVAVDTHWSELKIMVADLEGVAQANRLIYDVYFEKGKIVPFGGTIPTSAEAYATRLGFRNYGALDPGWFKIGLDANNVTAASLPTVQINGKDYLKQTVIIDYMPTPSINTLILGIVFNYLRYDGEVLVNNLQLQKRNYLLSSEGDDYFGPPNYNYNPEGGGMEDWQIAMIAVGSGIIAATGATLTVVANKKKKQKEEK